MRREGDKREGPALALGPVRDVEEYARKIIASKSRTGDFGHELSTQQIEWLASSAVWDVWQAWIGKGELVNRERVHAWMASVIYWQALKTMRLESSGSYSSLGDLENNPDAVRATRGNAVGAVRLLELVREDSDA